MTREGRAWLQAQPLPETAREQVTVAIAMVDALEIQLAPITKQLRAYARRQVGCRALMRHYGIGELTAVTILAELGDCRRFSSSRNAVRYSGLDITVHRSDQRRAPGHLSRQGPPALRWARFEAAQVARRTGSPDREYYRRAAGRLGTEPRLPIDRAQAPQAQLPHPVRTRRGGAGARLNPMMRAQPVITPMHRGRLPTCSRRHARVDGPERPSGRTAASCGITPSTIMSPTRSHPGPRTEIRLGARAHTPVPASAATAPVKRLALGPPGRPRGDRAPPPTLNQQPRVASATHKQGQPGSHACHAVAAQIRSSGLGTRQTATGRARRHA